MKVLKNEKQHQERGSATVEAIISFTGFLFVIFTILSVINFCRAQMLISNAVDTVAKEISQYSYFYKMSGLDKFSEELSNTAEDGKTNLNDVLGTVDNLYTSIGTAADNSKQHVDDVVGAAEEGTLNLTNIQNTLAGIKSDGTNIETSMNSVLSAFDSVQDNPLLYMKSIVAVAGNESLDLLKSHVIAAPLAKMFMVKHFGQNTAEANEKLEALGVVDGLDGMNFKMSTIFSSKSPEDVHIVVYYRLKLSQVFNWATLEVPMCKESVVRAWLGGDDVKVIVSPMVPTTTATPEPSPETSPEISPSPTPSSQSTGLWALPRRTEDGYFEVRYPAFIKYMGEQYGIETDANYAFLSGRNGPTGFACSMCIDDSQLLRGMGEDMKSSIAERAYLDSAISLKMMEDNYDPTSDIYGFNIKPGEIKSMVYTVYVPENIPEETLKAIKEKSEVGTEKCKQKAKETLGRELEVTIIFEKAGGNYDYENGD